MSNKTTEIAFILDRSGSMQATAESTLETFNSFISTQKKEHGVLPTRLSLMLFDTAFQVMYTSVPAPEVRTLELATYKPNGSTALLDAIGHTIEEMGKRLSAMPEAERPEIVIIAILTDGLENSSKLYDRRKIQEMIKHQQEVYSWRFLFLGANQDAIATASSMGINDGNSANFFQNDASIRAAGRATERMFYALKSPGLGGTRMMPDVSLDALVREEEALAVNKPVHPSKS